MISKWCSCKRRLLTLGQQRNQQLCEICQKEHAQSFQDRLEKLQKEEK